MKQDKLPRFNATVTEIAEIVPSLGGEARVLQFMGWKREPLGTGSKTAGFWIPPFNPHIRYAQRDAIKTSIWHDLRRFRRLRHLVFAEQRDQHVN